MSVVPDPATLEVGQLDLAFLDLADDVGEGDLGAIEVAHEDFLEF